MRRKIDELSFYNWLKENRNNSYYNFMRKAFNINGKKVYGTMYFTTKALTDNEKADLMEYPNIKLMESKCQYAPEIKNNVVVVMDRKIR